MSTSSSSERQLLFGLLALEQCYITRRQLLDALSSWLPRQEGALSDWLRQHGALSASQASAVEALVEAEGGPPPGDTEDEVGPLQSATTDHARGNGPALPPSVVRYRRLRPLAKGGLGEVFIAMDEELAREVALKEIQERHADNASSRSRFVREAEVTGNLEHPGVVPVYGLGTYPDGRPFYAMRLIQGENLHDAITRYHAAGPGPERERELRALLMRFVAVCNAVAYAHSRGVIHRDLKPANVMLGDFGETLVVDWGLAKRVGQAEAPGGAGPVEVESATVQGRAVGTPAFMPPEQARGEHDTVDGRSDVWALGATLYCLLTGRPPYAGADALRQAERGEVRPARQVNRTVARPLEAVCAKAMAARPEERYASAKELAAEVERWLADEPVRAYRDPLGVRVRRWAKHNTATVSAGVAMLLASVAGLALGLWAVNVEKDRTKVALVEAETNLARAKKAEAEATANLALSQRNLTLAKKAVDESFGVAKEHSLFNQPFLSPALRELRELLLRKALPFYQDFQEQEPNDEQSLQAVGLQHARLGDIQGLLGNRATALKHYREAEGSLRRLIKAHPHATHHRSNLVSVLTHRGLSHHALGQHKEALAALTEAAAFDRQLATDPASRPGHDNYSLASTLSNLGNLQRDLGQLRDASASHAEAIKVLRDLVKAHPKVADQPLLLAAALNNLGLVQRLDQPGEAEKLYPESIQLYQAMRKAGWNTPPALFGLGDGFNNLGALYAARGEHLKARQSFTDAVETIRDLVKAQPDVPAYQARLASWLHNLGTIQLNLGEHKKAHDTLKDSVALFRAVLNADRGVSLHQHGLATCLSSLAQLQSDLGQAKEAQHSCTEAIEVGRALVKAQPAVPEHHDVLATALFSQGGLQRKLGRAKEALRSFAEAAEHYRLLVKSYPTVPGYRAALASALTNRGSVLRELGETKQALQSVTEGIEQARALVKDDPGASLYRYHLITGLQELGLLRDSLGAPKVALASFTEGIELGRALVQGQPGVPTFRVALADTLFNRGVLQQKLAHLKEALLSFTEAIEMRRALSRAHPGMSKYHETLARALLNQGVAQRHLRQPKEALRSFTEAIEIQRALVKRHPGVLHYRGQLARGLHNLGLLQTEFARPAESVAHFTEATGLYRTLLKAQPDELDHQDGLASTLLTLGTLHQEMGQPKEALVSYTEAIALRRQRLKASPDAPLRRIELVQVLLAATVPRFALSQFAGMKDDLDESLSLLAQVEKSNFHHPLRAFFRWFSHQQRAEALGGLGRHRDALKDWDRAVSQAPPQNRLAIRTRRAACLARAGDHDGAFVEAIALLRTRSLGTAGVFDVVGVLSLSAAAANRDSTRPLPRRERDAELGCRIAVGMLQALVKVGHFRQPAARARLDKDADFAFLRDHPSYKRFRAQLP